MVTEPVTGNRSAQSSSQHVARLLVEEARWAPSVHNTQPWWFSFRGPRISLHADVDRRLDVADPDGREMYISCGAALLTLRLGARHRGYEPEVSELPEVDRPHLVADLSLARPVPGANRERFLYQQIRRRRTHRGAFREDQLSASLLSRLRDAAYHEGAALRVVADTPTRIALAALTEAAEQVQRLDPAYGAELARWSLAPGSRRDEGIHPTAYPRTAEQVEPHYPMRDFARGQGWGVPATESAPAPPQPGASGVVAVLTTGGDEPADWLHAGQALQRLLLHASAEGVSAAFHTQPLEVPELREFVATRFCDGARPQLLLRLGRADAATASPRRTAEQVMIAEP